MAPSGSGASATQTGGRGVSHVSPGAQIRTAASLEGCGGAERADRPACTGDGQRDRLLQGSEERESNAISPDHAEGVDAEQTQSHRVGDVVRTEDSGGAQEADAGALEDHGGGPGVPDSESEHHTGSAGGPRARVGAAAPAAPPAAAVEIAALNERIWVMGREHGMMGRELADWRQYWEMRISEEAQAHARTDRLKREGQAAAQKWWRAADAARADARAAREEAAEAKRSATAAEQETRRVTFQNLTLKRQLSLHCDVVPRAEHVRECDRLQAQVCVHSATIATLSAQLAVQDADGDGEGDGSDGDGDREGEGEGEGDGDGDGEGVQQSKAEKELERLRLNVGVEKKRNEPSFFEKPHGTCKSLIGLCCLCSWVSSALPVPIHHVNHMKAGCAYAPMHGIQFSETTTKKYSTEQKC